VVTKVVEPEPPALQVEFVELESVHSPRSTVMPRRSLTEVTKWRQDWLMRVEPSAHWAVKYPALDLLQRFLATDAE